MGRVHQGAKPRAEGAAPSMRSRAPVRRQFATRPYHEITLTTIAEELGWSRGQPLQVRDHQGRRSSSCSHRQTSADTYFDALLAALPEGRERALADVADTWADVASAHQEYFRLGDLLTTIVETNVTVERPHGLQARLLRARGRAARAPAAGHRHRAGARGNRCCWPSTTTLRGLVSSCWSNPLIAEALERLEIERPRAGLPRGDARLHRHVPRALRLGSARRARRNLRSENPLVPESAHVCGGLRTHAGNQALLAHICPESRHCRAHMPGIGHQGFSRQAPSQKDAKSTCYILQKSTMLMMQSAACHIRRAHAREE